MIAALAAHSVMAIVAVVSKRWNDRERIECKDKSDGMLGQKSHEPVTKKSFSTRPRCC